MNRYAFLLLLCASLQCSLAQEATTAAARLCPQCRTANATTAQFCCNCGADVSRLEATTQARQTPFHADSTLLHFHVVDTLSLTKSALIRVLANDPEFNLMLDQQFQTRMERASRMPVEPAKPKSGGNVITGFFTVLGGVTFALLTIGVIASLGS